MFELDEPDDDLLEPVFYTDGRSPSFPGPANHPRKLVYVAGPLWEVARSPAEAKAALDVASLAWNLTRLAEPERTEALRQVVRGIVERTGSADDFSEMVMRAMRWPRDPQIVGDVGFKELRPGEWHVAVLALTPAGISPRTSSPGAKPRGRRRG